MNTIRCLVMVSALIAMGCKEKQERPADVAVEALNELGAKVQTENCRPGLPVVKIDMSCVDNGDRLVFVKSTRVVDSSLAHLAPFTDLRTLNLRGTPITDRGLEHLQKLVTLQKLDLSGTKITDAGLEKLTLLTELRELSLAGIPLKEAWPFTPTWPPTSSTDTVLVGAARPSVISDPVARVDMSGRGLATLGAMSRLETLDLSCTRVTNGDLKHLGSLPRLRSLKLTGNTITSDGLIHLVGAGELEELDLSFTGVDNSVLRYLKVLPKLRKLSIHSTNIGRKAIAEFQESQPELTINHNAVFE